jgi:hypothetical protein
MPLPDTGRCAWSYDERTRVLLADFRRASSRLRRCQRSNTSDAPNDDGEGGAKQEEEEDDDDDGVRLTREDEVFLLEMMERDDVTVVSEGLADAVNDTLWTPDYIEGCIGSEYHHKFRSFVKVPPHPGGGGGGGGQQQPRENDGWYSMKFSDYFRYLQHRRECLTSSVHWDGSNANGNLDRGFTFIDSYGKEITVDVENEAIVSFLLCHLRLPPPRYFSHLVRFVPPHFPSFST